MVYCRHIRCSVPMLRRAGSRGLFPNSSLGHVVHYLGCWSYYLILHLNLNSEKGATWDSARGSSQQGTFLMERGGEGLEKSWEPLPVWQRQPESYRNRSHQVSLMFVLAHIEHTWSDRCLLKNFSMSWYNIGVKAIP